MKLVLTLLLISLSVKSKNFQNASTLVNAYKEYGFKINGDVRIDMFRRLSVFFDEIEKNLKKHDKIRAILSFISPEFDTKIFVQDGIVNIQIPEKDSAEILFSQFLRIYKINSFLLKNKIKSVFGEDNIHSFEQFIKIFNDNNSFEGVGLDKVEFKNIIYPKVVIRKKIIVMVLPIGDSFLYWQNVMSNIKDGDIAENLESLSLILSKNSQVGNSDLYKTLKYSSGILSPAFKDKTGLGKTRVRSKLLGLLAREYPPQVLPKEVVRAVENIPYRSFYNEKYKRESLIKLNSEAGLKDVKLKVVFLTPLRVSTISKVVTVLKNNTDLKNINLKMVTFDSNKNRPYLKKTNGENCLVLSDYSTRNNIYGELKKVPLK